MDTRRAPSPDGIIRDGVNGYCRPDRLCPGCAQDRARHIGRQIMRRESQDRSELARLIREQARDMDDDAHWRPPIRRAAWRGVSTSRAGRNAGTG